MTAGTGAYAVLSAVLVALGLYGVVARPQRPGVLLALGLLFLGPAVLLLGAAHAGGASTLPPQGDVLALLALLAAGALGSAGVGLTLLLWRRSGGTTADITPDLGE